MADDSHNESNLVQRREDRRTLEKMRRKLATSGTVSSKSDLPKHKGGNAKGSLRIWPLAAAAAVLLIAFNLFLRTRENHLFNPGSARTMGSNAVTPPPGLSMDEQVRFWAYAIYDIPKLRARFHIPKGSVVDTKGARKHLEMLLAENLGTEVRNEIFIFQQQDPVPVQVVKTQPIVKKK